MKNIEKRVADLEAARRRKAEGERPLFCVGTTDEIAAYVAKWKCEPAFTVEAEDMRL